MDKKLLFKPRVGEADVEIDGVGTVRVRGLNRDEMLGADAAGKSGVAAMERYMLSRAMVDPKLTEDEVAQWQAASPADEITAVVNKVNELSGIGKAAEKAAYEAFRNQTGS